MNDLTINEYNSMRVLSTQQIAEAYGTDSKVISNNFNRNKERYKEGKHFICLEGEEKRDFVNNHQIDDGSKKASKIYLWTEKGAFLHAKSLGTDEAWEVYEKLVDFYFNVKKPLSISEQVQIIAKGNMALEQKIDSVNEDLQTFKQDMPLLALECERITKAKNKKVVTIMGGKDSNAYNNNSLRGKVYRDVDSQLRREFGINTYKAIKRSQCDKAIQIVENYQLPTYLQEQIDNENNQMRFGI